MSRLPFAAVLLGCLALGSAAASRLRADEPPAPAAPAPSAEQVLGWVNDLGSDDFRTREQASRSLAAAGEAAREALETALKRSDSLEVRWRAQQLLLRLDGKGERTVEQGPTAPRLTGPRPGAQPEAADDLRRALLDANDPQALRELILKMFRDMPSRGPWREFEVAPFGLGNDFAMGGRLTAGDLTLKRGLLGMGPWVLEVRRQDETGRESRAAYSGESLEAILEANPALKEHPSLAELKQKLAEAQAREPALTGPSWRSRLGGPGPVPGFTFKTSQGVEIRQDAQGALVRVHEQGEDGKPQVKEYRGETLEQIQREHPELADRLGGLRGFDLRVGPPRVFRGPREEPLPALPSQPAPTAPAAGPVFGVHLEAVEPALASHLKLVPGRGVLVLEVVPGSQAAALGLQVYDVIESVDGAAVGLEDAIARLRDAARTQAPLSLAIVRDGARQALTR